MPTLTIVTPTYNRADCLVMCWESLRNQSCTDFQWLVVDDGSTDETPSIIAEICDQNPDFCIDYVQKKNGGKHTALNASHPYIKGRYVVVLDSDDRLISTAVQQILSGWNDYGNCDEVGQLIFLKGYSETEPICYVKNERTVVNTLNEPRIGISGRDCCDCFRTDLFIKYPFPEFPGEHFLGEGASFFFIELESKGIYINKVIYLCDYREDGLTKAGRKMRLQNPLGGRFNSMVYMHRCLPLKTRLKKAILYVCYSWFAGIPMKLVFRENPYKLLTCAALIPGTLLYYRWKKRYFS